jgi:hypothetical protein
MTDRDDAHPPRRALPARLTPEEIAALQQDKRDTLARLRAWRASRLTPEET